MAMVQLRVGKVPGGGQQQFFVAEVGRTRRAKTFSSSPTCLPVLGRMSQQQLQQVNLVFFKKWLPYTVNKLLPRSLMT